MNDPISAEDMFQQDMDVDVTWGTSMLTRMADGIPKQSFTFEEHTLRQESRFPFQLDKRFNVRDGEDTPPMQIDDYSSSFQPSTDRQGSHIQPSIEMCYLEQLENLKQKISFEELAFDLLVNPSEPMAFQDKTNGSQQGFDPIVEGNLSMYLLQSMFPPSSMQSNQAQVVNTSNNPDVQGTPQTPSDSSQDAPLDDIDDDILSPLSPVMSDDMYYFAMRESEGLNEFF